METEVKFYLDDFHRLEQRIQSLGARLVQPRILERNLRFDTPQCELSQQLKVLRLRQDSQAHLTYKEPGGEQDGVKSRTEIEFTVSDIDSARAFLESLGYLVYLIYEKYRTVYEWGDVQLMLDEMPFGKFLEIEGPDSGSIRRTAEELGLDWGARSGGSYTGLFERIKGELNLDFRDTTFELFSGIRVQPEDLGLRAADRPKD